LFEHFLALTSLQTAVKKKTIFVGFMFFGTLHGKKLKNKIIIMINVSALLHRPARIGSNFR
jgi:hypothetical protein